MPEIQPTMLGISLVSDQEKFSRAAQLDVLQKCASVIPRLLTQESGEQSLLAAKIYLISRLVLKTFSEKVGVKSISPSSLYVLTVLNHRTGTHHSSDLCAVNSPLLGHYCSAISILCLPRHLLVFRH